MRDQLAANLEILEPRLRLVRTEARLVAQDGRTGRVDILGRDRHDNIVIIEVKRSNKAAREAAHEVFKYTEILCREQGHPPERIRVMIASTEWAELDLSYSGYAGLTGFDLRGYHLQLDETGNTLTGAKPVTLKGPARKVEPSDIHLTFVFKTETDRNEGWTKLQDRSQNYGAPNLLAFDFTTDDERALGPYLLYVVIGSIDPNAPFTDRILPAHPEDETDFRDREHFLQYWLVARLLPDITMPSGWDASHPKQFFQMLAGRSMWRFEERVRCSGTFSLQDHIFGVRDWVALVTVKSGLEQTTFFASATPSQRTAWTAFKQRISMAMGTNPDWCNLVAQALQRIEDEHPEADVEIEILNPTDLVGVLLGSWPDQVQLYEPQLSIRVSNPDVDPHVIRGALVGPAGKIDFLSRFRMVYRDPFAWIAARASDAVESVDLELLEAMELRYVLLEYTANPDLQLYMHYIDGDQPRVRVASPVPEPRGQLQLLAAASLSDFLEAHQHQVDLLVNEYRASLGIERP
nr:endonuclease NucS domain-containing protein [Glycomyces amatae]